jgi:hypothetical protein
MSVTDEGLLMFPVLVGLGRPLLYPRVLAALLVPVSGPRVALAPAGSAAEDALVADVGTWTVSGRGDGRSRDVALRLARDPFRRRPDQGSQSGRQTERPVHPGKVRR